MQAVRKTEGPFFACAAAADGGVVLWGKDFLLFEENRFTEGKKSAIIYSACTEKLIFMILEIDTHECDPIR